MVILHILAPGEVGGLERVVRSLIAGQKASGHTVYAALVIDPGCAAPAFARILENAGASVITIPVSSRAYLAERAAVAAACERVKPDIVHTHGYRPDVVDAGVARRRGIPTVTTVHGFTGGGWKDRLYERLQRRAFRRFSAVVAVSNPLRAELQRSGVPGESLHMIRNAWDGTGGEASVDRRTARRALGLPADGTGVGIRLGWVGRLSREKGADVVIEALPLLQDIPASLSLLGDGPERRTLEARSVELGIAERITFHGTVPDAATLFCAFDVFVLSSHTEGTPIVLLEAMAAGVPIVATAVGGVPDVVPNGEAWLVPPNDPRALATVIRSVVQDEAEVQRRTAAARRRLDAEFGLVPWLERYESLYRAVRQ